MKAFTISCKYPGLILSHDSQFLEKVKGGIKKRDIERASVKFLLEENGFHSEIRYSESGAPTLVRHPEFNLSISHSNGWYAVFVSEHKCGVDIEVLNERLLQARDYFCNELEKHFVTLRDLQLIWGAKEAIYKCFDGQIADLCKDVTVESIGNNTINVRYLNATHICHYEVKDNVYLVLINV